MQIINPSLIDELKDRLENAAQIIRENYDNIDEPEYELGYLNSLETICYELKKPDPIKSLFEHLSQHINFVIGLEKAIIERNNENESDFSKWAEPISIRIADELKCLEVDSDDYETFVKTLSALLRHNPSLTKKLIGTATIEETYFDKLL